jgi:hypothetical protein
VACAVALAQNGEREDSARHGIQAIPVRYTVSRRTLQTVIPIICAPLLFREQWPAAAGYQSLLAGGIVLTLVGIVIVSHHHEGVVQAYARADRAARAAGAAG